MRELRRREMHDPAAIVERMTADMDRVGHHPDALYRLGWPAAYLVEYWHRADALRRGVPFMIDRDIECECCRAVAAAVRVPQPHTDDMRAMCESLGDDSR